MIEPLKPLYMLFPEHLITFPSWEAVGPGMEERWHAVHVQLNLPSLTREWVHEQQKKTPKTEEAPHV